MSTSRPRDDKVERITIRRTKEEKALVEHAARASRVTFTQFVLQAALGSAEEVVGDQTRFTLPASEWEKFVTLLDRPPRGIRALREAASKPSPFGRG
jgi:uncharacterized protein (DUF1778 family)